MLVDISKKINVGYFYVTVRLFMTDDSLKKNETFLNN
jgi:hypothetical protein